MKKRQAKKNWAKFKKDKLKPHQPYLVAVELPEGFESKYPFANGDTMLMLGDIEQMPGHVVVVNKDGRVFWGYHDDNFRKLTEEEA
jgi:hypothetical protein